MHATSNPFPSSSPSGYPRDLRSTAFAARTHDLDPAVVADFKAKMAQLPGRIRPLLSDEKMTVVGRGRKQAAPQEQAHQSQAVEPKGATKAMDTVTPSVRRRVPTTVVVQAAQSAAPSAPTPAPETNRKAAASTPHLKPESEPITVNPAEIYPASVIRAAKKQTKVKGRRNLSAVLTDDVLAIWDRWNTEDGRSCVWIGKKVNNGLIEVANNEVGRYLRQYRERQEEAAMAFLPQPETAVIGESATNDADAPEPPTKVDTATADAPIETPVREPAPEQELEIESLETAVSPFKVERPENLSTFFDRDYRPQRQGPGDALATLAALVNSEQLRIKGSVKLNLEIEFGD